uniref:Uncharacterized protein n=1 Tax=Candidatus Methanogaster sp. ANME-2c ERB4 TaxID=2759911 RepID=A0A7G9YNI6_9EURY|nr:hypothetical protein IDCAPMJN_00006 [Methanosarcinales archaeon ANME-2c ERB4]
MCEMRLAVLASVLAGLLLLAALPASASAGLAGWQYQREIAIQENSGETLSDYQVLVALAGSDFPEEAQAGGDDIRFTDADGNELSYWVEEFDAGSEHAKIWVKVPEIPANGAAGITMWYGNPGAGSVSDGEAVFEFFDDFDTNTLSNYDVNLDTIPAPGWKPPVDPTYDPINKRVSINNGDNIETTISPKNIDFLDVYAEAIFHLDGAYPEGGTGKISIRWQDANNWYQGGKSGAGYSKTGGGGGACSYISPAIYKIIASNDACLAAPKSNSYINLGTEQKIGLSVAGNTLKLFINDDLVSQTTDSSITSSGRIIFSGIQYRGWIDNIRVRRYASSEPTITLTPPAPATHTTLAITKSPNPHSIRQFQETTLTISIKNSGTTDATDIEITDRVHPSFDLTSGDFPNPKRYDLIRPGETRDLQYTIRAMEGGTFTLDPATVTYADEDGNIQEAPSEPASIKVIPSTEGGTSGSTPRSNPSVTTASVQLHGEKTNVVLGEDILLKLSAVNLITKPTMHVQVIIIPPSGMSVTSSAFAKSGAGQYTTTYELEPGSGKDIEVAIRSNQVGDFDVNGRIIYYFGDDREDAEDHTLTLPITVRAEAEPGADQTQSQSEAKESSTPGFGVVVAVIGLFAMYLWRKIT